MRRKKRSMEDLSDFSDISEIEDIQPEVEEAAAPSEEPGPAESATALAREKDELLDQLLRKQAEFENYRKRVVREKLDARLAAQEEVLREILPVIDSCEMALDGFEETPEEDSRLEAYREGYQLLLKSLQALLTRFGVTLIPGQGQPFDPSHHEAVLREERTDVEDGQVIDEFRKGYLFQGRLLRPSQVRVAVRPEETTSN